MQQAFPDLPPLELIESTHYFPGPYMFKVIGRGEEGFAARVVAAVRAGLGTMTDCPYRLQHTPNGRYVSVTLEPELERAADVLEIYRRFRELPGVLMYW